MANSVVAVVLNWNKPDYTMACVEHLLCQSDAELTVLVIDNGSTDDSIKRFQSLPASSCRVLPLASNEGFAGGMNAGLREAIRAGVDYVWLVNNDALPRPDCLRALVEQMRREPQLAMVTPLLVSNNGDEQHVGGIVDWSTGELRYLSAAELSEEYRDGRWITGTAPLLRTAAVARNGLFELDFFAYWEDVDLSVRLTRQGCSLRPVAEAVTVHLGSSSLGCESPLSQFLATRNAWLFLERNARAGSNRVRWMRFVAASTRRAALFDLNGQTTLATATLAGIFAARQRRFGPPDSRMLPGMLERATFRARWQWIDLLNTMAGWLEPNAT